MSRLLIQWTFAWVLFVSQLGAQDVAWNRFRGPNGSGLDESQALPTDFDTKKAIWSVSLPGAGHSSPVVWEDRIWTTSFEPKESKLILSCHNRINGELLWERDASNKEHPMHRLNNSAASTPAVDELGIYWLTYQPEELVLRAYDHDGGERWQRNFGKWVAQHGFATSPVVQGNQVIFLNSQESFQGLPEPGDSVCIAVNRESGETNWICDLQNDKACYAVPVVWEDKTNDWLLCATQGDGVLAIDSKSGRVIWKSGVFKQRTVGSPIVVGSRLLANNGSGGGGNYVVSIPLDTKTHTPEFEIHQGASYVPTLISVRDLLFIFGDTGIVTCNRVSNGEELWRQRISEGFWGSPVSDGRHLYCLDKNGNVHVLKVAEKAEVVGNFPLGRESQASAAISQGRIYFRTLDRLWCFGGQ